MGHEPQNEHFLDRFDGTADEDLWTDPFVVNLRDFFDNPARYPQLKDHAYHYNANGHAAVASGLVKDGIITDITNAKIKMLTGCDVSDPNIANYVVRSTVYIPTGMMSCAEDWTIMTLKESEHSIMCMAVISMRVCMCVCVRAWLELGVYLIGHVDSVASPRVISLITCA